MENSTSPQPYHDSPTSPQSSSPPRHTHTPSTSSSNSSSIIKPLPPLPHQAPAYEPYRDDPATTAYRDDPNTSTDNSTPADPQTPLLTPSATDDENIPLAYLITQPYPHEAPPSYSVAIRQTHSTRDTLIQYIPNDSYTSHHDSSYNHASRHSASWSRENGAREVVVEFDPESGEVVSRTDDNRYGVEKVVAMFVVALMLLSLSGVLGWMAFGW